MPSPSKSPTATKAGALPTVTGLAGDEIAGAVAEQDGDVVSARVRDSQVLIAVAIEVADRRRARSGPGGLWLCPSRVEVAGAVAEQDADGVRS